MSEPRPRSHVGSRIAHYEVIALLGAGGMGEVYRARDSNLGRDVAIKILPSIFLDDPDRRARFEREARVLASINHPHIGSIYGIESAPGIRAIVLELIEGETLAERLAEWPLPLVEALAVCRTTGDRARDGSAELASCFGTATVKRTRHEPRTAAAIRTM